MGKNKSGIIQLTLLGVLTIIFLILDNEYPNIDFMFYFYIAVLPAVFLVSFVYIVIKIYLIKSKDRQLDYALCDKCDPEKFLQINEKLRDAYYDKSTDEFSYFFNRAVGLRNLGQFDAALEELAKINIEKNMHAGRCALYYSNLSDLYFWKENYKEAKAAIDKAISNISREGMNEQVYNNVSLYTTSNRLSINYLTDGSGKEEYEAFFLKEANEKLDAYRTIENKTNLGIFYFKEGQYTLAKGFFAYIVKNGNKLFHVGIAKKYLAEIEKKNG